MSSPYRSGSAPPCTFTAGDWLPAHQLHAKRNQEQRLVPIQSGTSSGLSMPGPTQPDPPRVMTDPWRVAE